VAPTRGGRLKWGLERETEGEFHCGGKGRLCGLGNDDDGSSPFVPLAFENLW
jgi:hypothetical protein